MANHVLIYGYTILETLFLLLCAWTQTQIQTASPLDYEVLTL